MSAASTSRPRGDAVSEALVSEPLPQWRARATAPAGNFTDPTCLVWCDPRDGTRPYVSETEEGFGFSDAVEAIWSGDATYAGAISVWQISPGSCMDKSVFAAEALAAKARTDPEVSDVARAYCARYGIDLPYPEDAAAADPRIRSRLARGDYATTARRL